MLGDALNYIYSSLVWISSQSSREVVCLSIVIDEPMGYLFGIDCYVFIGL